MTEFKPHYLIGLIALAAWLCLAAPVAIWGWSAVNPALAWLILPTTPFLISFLIPPWLLLPWAILLFSTPSTLSDTSASSMDGGAFFAVGIIVLNLPILLVRMCLALSGSFEKRSGYLE
ncbi:hypothetical protein HJG53_07055 [Sphingomonas sp. ID1715]|uniref:hypothetical protein n=1 Tax=Sphingomonas sp. ID1715 TaxID=1656898 RepID=UPI001487DFE1|nr:hypothetical protein [Sphingomonas sp. ID1715]NNM76656.1 hypothetical protein [Sphingomonas sp. ID1715]